MNLGEVKKLNQLVAEPTDGDHGCRICVDTFRTPYILWDQPIQWPSLSVLHAEAESCEPILRAIMQRSPWLLRGAQLLPEARPRRDEPNLHMVKLFRIEEQQYLLKTKLLMTYMGGAHGEELEDRSVQDRNPAFQSDRIYYQCRLFPVSSVKTEDGAVVDFEPEHYGPASGMQNTVGEAHQTARWNVMLFDEMDFSELEQGIREIVSSRTWKPGRLFNPFVIDHGTVNWNVFHLKDISRFLPHFHRLWLHLKDGTDFRHEDHLFWDEYYESWEYNRFLSRGGNPHWEIVQAPGWPT